jgi:hypothetical protein
MLIEKLTQKATAQTKQFWAGMVIVWKFPCQGIPLPVFAFALVWRVVYTSSVGEQSIDCDIKGKIPTHADISSTNIDGDSINPFILALKTIYNFKTTNLANATMFLIRAQVFASFESRSEFWLSWQYFPWISLVPAKQILR